VFPARTPSVGGMDETQVTQTPGICRLRFPSAQHLLRLLEMRKTADKGKKTQPCLVRPFPAFPCHGAGLIGAKVASDGF